MEHALTHLRSTSLSNDSQTRPGASTPAMGESVCDCRPRRGPSQAPQRVAEVLVLREVDLLLFDRPHQFFSISILLGLSIEHADGAVFAAGRDPPAIGAEGHAGERRI